MISYNRKRLVGVVIHPIQPFEIKMKRASRKLGTENLHAKTKLNESIMLYNSAMVEEFATSFDEGKRKDLVPCKKCFIIILY